MKKIVLLMLGLLFLPMMVSAYQVNIDAPETLTVGKPLVVTGTTTFGIGTPIDVVLYHQLTTTSEVKRKIVYIQTDKTFKAVFDTTGLPTGTYKVEVPTNGMGDSITMRIVQLVDRSDSLHLTSPLSQPFTGKISVVGSIMGSENSGIQVEVVGPDNAIIFGPRFVDTNNAGSFSFEVPITRNGEYEVSFTDMKGYIGAKTFTIAGEPSVSQIATIEPTTTVKIIGAHTSSTHENPAYFIVKTNTGPALLYTSPSVDWVIEYVDESGAHTTVNTFNNLTAERVELNGRGKTLYVKVYPQQPGGSGLAFLYGQNVRSLIVSPDIPLAFGESTTSPAETTQSAPLPLLGILGVVITVILLKRLK